MRHHILDPNNGDIELEAYTYQNDGPVMLVVEAPMDGAAHLNRDKVVGLRDFLTKWLEENRA